VAARRPDHADPLSGHGGDLARAEGTTMAAIVRRALDAFLAAERPSPSAALAATFGAVPRLSEPDRDGWDRG
jgi:hypothetical protein